MIRGTKPGWMHDAEGLDPADLLQPKSRNRSGGEKVPPTPPPEPWTPERYATTFLSNEPALRHHRPAGRGRRIVKGTVAPLLNVALDMRQAFRWKYANPLPDRFARAEQPLTAIAPPTPSPPRAAPPHAPRHADRAGAGEVPGQGGQGGAQRPFHPIFPVHLQHRRPIPDVKCDTTHSEGADRTGGGFAGGEPGDRRYAERVEPIPERRASAPRTWMRWPPTAGWRVNETGSSPEGTVNRGKSEP